MFWATVKTAPAYAQADAWAIGNRYSILPQAYLPDPEAPAALPTHPLGTPNAYTGAIPQRSQHVRSAGDGRILFFEVDGNLYDGQGWLIADSRAQGCQDCLEPGAMEFISVPVPGSCNLFYLLSAAATGPVDANFTYSGSHIQWSILDLDAENPRFPEDPSNPYYCPKRGRLMPQQDILAMPQFQGFEVYPEAFGDPGLYSSDRVGFLSAPTFSRSITPMMRLVQSANGTSWLFVVMNDRVHLYHITASGIQLVDALPNDPTRNWVQIFSLNPTGKAYFRDADAVMTVDAVSGNEVLVLAMTDGDGMKLWPDINSNYNLVVHRYDGTTGAYLPTQSTAYSLFVNPAQCSAAQPAVGVAPGLRGCALTADGSGIYLLGERTPDCITWQTFAAHMAIGTGAITDLGYAFGGSIPANLTRSRIYRNNMAHVVNDVPLPPRDAIYLPGATTVGALIGIQDPNNLEFQADVFDGLQVINFNNLANAGHFKPRFLNVGVVADRYLSAANRENCCVFLGTHGSGVVGLHEQVGYGMWTNEENPYGDQEQLIFTCDLVVKPGASLYLNHLDLRFAPEAKLVVERGGKVVGYNTSFTSLACPNERWPGIRVEGNTNNPVQAQTGSPVDGRQGWLTLDLCTVDNAEVGVWCAREVSPGTSTGAHFGGVVRATGTGFVNCIVGAKVERYQRSSSSGAILPNLCQFSACTFETNSDWPDLGTNTPRHHASLFDVQGIRFVQCKFLNEASGSFPLLQRGWGVWAFAAGFDVEGSGIENASLFQGLTAGVVAATGPVRKANVRRSWFRNNYVGAQMQSCTSGPEVSRSHFFVPPSAGSDYPPTGLILHGSSHYLIEENDFHGGGLTNMNVGLLIRGEVRDANRIYNNNFTGLAAGTYTNDRQKGYDPNTGQEYAGLKLLCSDYTDCGFEHLLGDNTYIDAAQGDWNGFETESQLAANRFFNGGIPGISISTVQPQGANAPFFNYIRHNVTECDPHDDNNPYFNDIRIDQATDFTKTVACGNGYLSDIGGGGGVSGYRLASAQLLSVKANFNGTVDTGEKVDIEEAIKQRDPVLPSHTLRDYLLARCPLSDAVLLEVIFREEPMEPWHITQVMLGNARLTSRVMEALVRSELLNAYMLSIVRNAGNGPTVKDLLQQELAQRSAEKAHYLVLALDELLADSTLASPTDSLFAMMAYAPDGGDLYGLAQIAMAQGDHLTATAWLDSLAAVHDPGQDLLRELAVMQQQVGNDWQHADSGQRTHLEQLADKRDPGSAYAWAIRYHLGETQELPLLPLPAATKRYQTGRHTNTGTVELQMVQAHPNPTTGRSMVVIGSGVDEAARLHLSDPMGRLIRTLPVGANQQLLELDLSGLADGLYVIELFVGDFKIGATKLTLQH
jgi:hypothetical protein